MAGTKMIQQIDRKGNVVATYESITQAAKEIGGFKGNISAACHGKLISAYGYRWAIVANANPLSDSELRARAWIRQNSTNALKAIKYAVEVLGGVANVE